MRTCCKISKGLRHRFCTTCEDRLVEYEIIKNADRCGYLETECDPYGVRFLCVLLNEEHFDKVRSPIHRVNCFIQDPGHDWYAYRDGIKISLSGNRDDGPEDILIEKWRS